MLQKKNEFGRHLEAIRISKGISLEELAEATRIRAGILDNYEKGYGIPKKPLVHSIARALDCDVRNLLASRNYSLAAKRTNRNK